MGVRVIENSEKKEFYNLEEIENSVIWGDALEILPKLPAETMNAIFVDPPYFFQAGRRRIGQWSGKSVYWGWEESWDEFESYEQYDNFIAKVLMGCRRLMRPNATIWVMGAFSNICRIGKIMQDLGFWFLSLIVWEKTKPVPNFLNRRPANATEFLIWAVKDKSVRDYTYDHRYAKMISQPRYKFPVNIWELPICREERLKDERGRPIHPTQKPETLLERVILMSTKEGDLILDPMCGTGTTGVVALRYNRRFVMIEKEERYVKAASERIKAAFCQKTILD
jgi:DNA modification methylase